MNLVNKVFEIIADDEELLMQFPELKKGVVFKVITVADRDLEYADGITSVKIKNGPYLHVNTRDSWFWCFYCEATMNQLKEVEEFEENQHTGRHKGRLIENSLYELADSGVLSDKKTDLIVAAADYIHWLEVQLRASKEAF